MAFDDDDDYDELDLDADLFEDDEDDEPMPIPGITRWSALWIAADAASTLVNAIDHILYNIKVDLVYRHNKEVDAEDFVGSVRAGLEKL